MLILLWLQNVEGAPILELNSGPEAVGLYLSGGSSDGVLTFLYSISEGDSTPDLDTNGQNSLVVPEGSSIKVRKYYSIYSVHTQCLTIRQRYKKMDLHETARILRILENLLFQPTAVCCLELCWLIRSPSFGVQQHATEGVTSIFNFRHRKNAFHLSLIKILAGVVVVKSAYAATSKHIFDTTFSPSPPG